MPEFDDVRDILQVSYPLNIDTIEFNRDGGSMSYIIHAGGRKFFLRVIRPEFMDTALKSVDIHLYLSDRGFPVPAIIRTGDNAPFVRWGENERAKLCVLYEFIEGQEPKSEDAESVGRLAGQFHRVMREYPGQLAFRDKRYFIDRYVHNLRQKSYPKAGVFEELGEKLWERVKNLPRGFCHGDLYRGNVHKGSDGALYFLDLDTCCSALPIYDAVLFCNETNYFDYKNDGLKKTQKTFKKFLSGYSLENAFTDAEIAAFGDLMAIYHYQVQATVIEIYGLDCVDEPFIDNQLDWTERWLKQCEGVSWG